MSTSSSPNAPAHTPVEAHLDTPIQTLLSTTTVPLPYQKDVLLRSFVLQRPAGNVVVYNTPGISAAADAIQQLGAVTRLLLNHEHEAMYGAPDIDVPVFVNQHDAAAVAQSMPVEATFSTRQMIDDDLEVIPTPGHTAGTTCYLWDSGAHRFLFTGDFIWVEQQNWRAVVLTEGLRQAYLDSLALVRDLDFDVLVPWGVSQGQPSVAVTDAQDKRRRIDAIIARVSAGSRS